MEKQLTPMYVLSSATDGRVICAARAVADLMDYLLERKMITGQTRAWPIDRFGAEDYYTAPLEAIYGTYWEEKVRALSRSEFNMSFAGDLYIVSVPTWFQSEVEKEEDTTESHDPEQLTIDDTTII